MAFIGIKHMQANLNCIKILPAYSVLSGMER